MSTSAIAKKTSSGEASGVKPAKEQAVATRPQVESQAKTSRASRRVRKSADAFRTISEVADELGVQQHVLRFWETKFPQIKPLKRGGGRRYYRPENIELLKKIHNLLYVQGYTIKGVQRLLRQNRGVLPESSGHSAPMAQQDAPQKIEAQADLLSPATTKRSDLQAILRELKEARQLLSDRGF